MAHWTTPWLARRWARREYECVHFVAEVLRDEFGRNVCAPRAPAGLRVRDAALRQGLLARARRTGAPVDGDLVLMTMAGGVRARDYHLGIYVSGAAPGVMHLAPVDGVKVHRIDELHQVGFALEGFYRCAP